MTSRDGGRRRELGTLPRRTSSLVLRQDEDDTQELEAGGEICRCAGRIFYEGIVEMNDDKIEWDVRCVVDFAKIRRKKKAKLEIRRITKTLDFFTNFDFIR